MNPDPQEPTEQPERWLTRGEFCRMYRVSPDSLKRMAREGSIKVLRGTRGRGKKYYYRILDPGWQIYDKSANTDPVENLYLLKRAEVAALLGVTPDAVQKMSTEGRIRFLVIRGARRYNLAEVRRILTEHNSGERKPSRRKMSLAVVGWARQKLAGEPNSLPVTLGATESRPARSEETRKKIGAGRKAWWKKQREQERIVREQTEGNRLEG